MIWTSEYSFKYWNRGRGSVTRNIVFEHTTCVDAGCGWGHEQRPDPNGRHLMFYDNSAATTNFVIAGNIFFNATDSLLRLHGRDWTRALVMDRNCWHPPAARCCSGASGVSARTTSPPSCTHAGLIANPCWPTPSFSTQTIATTG